MARMGLDDFIKLSDFTETAFVCDFGHRVKAVEWVDPEAMEVGIFLDDDDGKAYVLTDSDEFAAATIKADYIKVSGRERGKVFLNKTA